MTGPTALTADQAPTEEPLDDTRLMDHAYDGIREYDNPLPGWWRMFFIGSIIFAGFYGLYFHVVRWGATTDQRYQVARTGYEEERAARGGEVAAATEESLARDANSEQALAKGAEVFAARCAACHKDHGEGLIGPNLTDQYQKHGTSRIDIYRTIANGVQGTPMIAWSEQLPLSEVNAVAAFVTTLRGKNVAGKAPEGNPVGGF